MKITTLTRLTAIVAAGAMLAAAPIAASAHGKLESAAPATAARSTPRPTRCGSRSTKTSNRRSAR